MDTTVELSCNINELDEKLQGKPVLIAIKAIIAMIDTVMTYVADRCYSRSYIEIDDISLHGGKIRVGRGDDMVSSKGFWAEYCLERGTLEYDSWGIRTRDTFHGTIEKPWEIYRKVVSGIEEDIAQHVIQKGNFNSSWC